MAWNRIQSVSGNNGSGTTLGVTFTTANLSAGTKLIAYCMVDGGATLSTVKDGAGNTFASMASKAAGDGSTLTILELDTPAGDVGTKPTITLTITGTNGGLAMLVQEVAGLVRGTTAAVVLDGTAGLSNGSFVSVSTGSATLASYTSSVPGEYLVAAYADNGDSSGSSQTTPTGYTADTHNVAGNSNADLGVFYRGSSGAAEAPASISVTALNSGHTYDWATIFVAFRLALAWNLAQPARHGLPQLSSPAPAAPTRPRSPPPPRRPLSPRHPCHPISGPGHGRASRRFPRGAAPHANGATPVHNPTSGPVFRQATQPIRARVPQVFSRGRAYGDQGAPASMPGLSSTRCKAPGRACRSCTPAPGVPTATRAPRFTTRRRGPLSGRWPGRSRPGVPCSCSAALSPAPAPRRSTPGRRSLP